LRSSLGDLFQAQKKLLLVEIASFGQSNFAGGVDLVKQLRDKSFIEDDDEMKQVISSFMIAPTPSSNQNNSNNANNEQSSSKTSDSDKSELKVIYDEKNSKKKIFPYYFQLF